MTPTDLQIAADFLEENDFPEDVVAFLRNTPAAIVTGSRKYGSPRGDSDLDLAVLLSKEDMPLLASVADTTPGCLNREGQPEYDSDAGWSYRFGRLNLIACDNPAQWEVWHDGTNQLLQRARRGETLSRDEAVRQFRALIANRSQELLGT